MCRNRINERNWIRRVTPPMRELDAFLRGDLIHIPQCKGKQKKILYCLVHEFFLANLLLMIQLK